MQNIPRLWIDDWQPVDLVFQQGVDGIEKTDEKKGTEQFQCLNRTQTRLKGAHAYLARGEMLMRTCLDHCK